MYKCIYILHIFDAEKTVFKNINFRSLSSDMEGDLWWFKRRNIQ